MDGRQLDALARHLERSHPQNRRRTLGAVLGGGLAALLGREEPAAACAPVGKRCKKKNGKRQKCCGGARCVGSRCRCTNGETNSGGVCATAPVCQGPRAACPGASQCCSNICLGASGGCDFSTLGERCRADTDCNDGFNDLRCVGFRCGCPKGEANSGGICAKKPNCRGRAANCLSDSQCCSNVCGVVATCGLSTFGERCLVDADCAGGFTCRGFVCG